MNFSTLTKLLLVICLTAMIIPSAKAEGLQQKLKGYILLQVEENGEAWYINTEDQKRYYLKDGLIAYVVLREFGLGITNKNLNKIPVGVEDRFTDTDTDGDGLTDKLEEGLATDINNPDTDGDGYNDGIEVRNGYNPLGTENMSFNYNLVNQLKGKILLQVESRGEAWYINPTDGKRYYMQNGDAAYEIMRYLSLGITNQNLEQFQIGELQFGIEPTSDPEPSSDPDPDPEPAPDSDPSSKPTSDPTPDPISYPDPTGEFQISRTHQTTQEAAINRIDNYLEEIINKEYEQVTITDKYTEWNDNILNFSFTGKKLFITMEIKGQIIITDTEVKLGLDFPDIIKAFITEEAITEQIDKKFAEIFDLN